MIAGITEKEQKIIERILDKYRKDYAFFYYGSRVKGTYEKTSDLDVLIKGKAEMPLAILQEIKEEFDKSDLPYIVNFSDYYKLDSSFYERIKPDLIPYNWQEVKLGDVCLFIDYRGKTPHKTTSGIPLITAKIVKNGRINEATEFISLEEYKARMTRGLPNIGDILITTEAPMGEVAELKNDKVAIGQRIITLRPQKNILNNRYLKYFLQSNIGRNQLRARESGTTVTGIKSAELKQISIYLPPLEVQKKIAGVLGALDDKIELNNKINQNLEAQAQALFLSYSQYFNTKKTLFDIATIRYGKGLPTSKLQKNGYEVFGGNGVIGFYSSYLYEEPQILISCRGAASGTILESHPYSYVTNNSLIIELKDRKYYQFLKQYFLLNQLCSYATGSAQPQITIDNLKMVEVPYPNYESISTLDKCLETISNNAYNNIQENTQLAELRDTLLPKLMSGEINVDDVKID